MFVCVWCGEGWRRELGQDCVCVCVCVHVCVSRVGEGGRAERNKKRCVCVEEEVWRE